MTRVVSGLLRRAWEWQNRRIVVGCLRVPDHDMTFFEMFNKSVKIIQVKTTACVVTTLKQVRKRAKTDGVKNSPSPLHAQRY
jgi:hypothetical protein